LQHVGQLGDLDEAEHAAGALDRVRGAEDRVQVLGRRGGDVDAQEDALDVRQVIDRLFEEDGVERRGVAERAGGGAHSMNCRTMPSIFSGSNGFTIQPVAPASRPRAFSSAPVSVESTISATLSYSGSPRSARTRVTPSIFGMLWSVTTRSK